MDSLAASWEAVRAAALSPVSLPTSWAISGGAPLTLPAAAAVALFLFVLEYWRAFPFAYHARVLSLMARTILFSRKLAALDEVTTWRGRVHVGELDWNGHQNNSVYALEIDVQRYAWFIRLLAADGYALFRSGLKIANGGVSFWFLKEMRWGQGYTIRTRLVAVDAKWMYLESRFVAPPRAPGGAPTNIPLGISRNGFKA
jgi:acyl-CoA thioesterase FadM